VIETGRLIPFLLTEFGLFLTPGPSVVFVVGRGVAYGRRAALTAVAGNTGGLATQLLLVVIILGGLSAEEHTVSKVLKLFGAAFLVYLGVRTIQRRRAAPTEFGTSAAESATPSASTRVALLRTGWTVGFTNPKGLVTFTSIAPSFIHRAGGQITLAVAALGALAVLVAFVSDGAWGLASGTARAWLGRSPRRLERLNLGSGLLMVAFGIGLALIALKLT
jgi:threonine/homoserine/homoserine lactone efflux protein